MLLAARGDRVLQAFFCLKRHSKIICRQMFPFLYSFIIISIIIFVDRNSTFYLEKFHFQQFFLKYSAVWNINSNFDSQKNNDTIFKRTSCF